MELMKEFRFEASHILPKHPGKCSRLHGHSWMFRIYVEGKLNLETGFVVDFYDLSEVGNKIVRILDHRHLGTWSVIERNSWGVDYDYMRTDFYPTSENLLMWMANFIHNSLPWSKLEIHETCTSAATLTREEYDGLST